MDIPLLQTKLYMPPAQPVWFLRPRLVKRLNASLDLGCKLTLVSARAGFGKTTLVSEWVHAILAGATHDYTELHRECTETHGDFVVFRIE